MENEIQKITPPCIVCGLHRSSTYAVKNGWRIAKCASCGTLFLDPLPDAHASAAVYGADYFGGAKAGYGYVDYDADKEAMKSVFNKHLAHLEKIIGKPGRLLDIGAATGFFLKLAENRGWQAQGIEISPYASEIARKKGLLVATGTLAGGHFKPTSFDVITMWDVIEHVPDPVGDLKVVRELLRSGGILALNTPDSGSLYARLLKTKWHLLVPPEDIWYFNRKSLAKLLEKTGFEVLEVGCVGKKFTLEYALNMLYRWQKLRMWHTLSRVLARMGLAKIALPINFRDNMYVLARKKSQ